MQEGHKIWLETTLKEVAKQEMSELEAIELLQSGAKRLETVPIVDILNFLKTLYPALLERMDCNMTYKVMMEHIASTVYLDERYENDDDDDDDSDSESLSSEYIPAPKKRKGPTDQHVSLTDANQLDLLRANIRKLKPAFLQLQEEEHKRLLRDLFELEASRAPLEKLRPLIVALNAAKLGWSEKYANILESICNIESDLE